MTKMTLAIAVALLAGTTMTGAANAGGLRLGFGFPLGSFVAHDTLSGGNSYGGGRDYDRPRAARRSYQEEAPARRVAKVKRTPKVEVADAPAPQIVKKAEVKTATVDTKLNSDPATTTEIAKTSTTTDTSTAPVVADTAEIETTKVATAEKTSNGKSDLEPVATASNEKQVCRRYSPTIAALVDVPCE